MSALVRTVAVDGWTLAVQNEADEHPTVEDLELATRLGFARPRKVRELIGRLLRDGLLKDSDVRPTVGRSTNSPFQRGRRAEVEYRLTEAGALKVIARSETPVANAILEQVIDVFIAYRRGLIRPAAPAVLATGVRVADNMLAREDVSSRCRLASAALGVHLGRVHGAVRRQFLVPGVYHVPLALLPIVREFLEALALRRLLLPGAPRRLPPKKDDRQLDMWRTN